MLPIAVAWWIVSGVTLVVVSLVGIAVIVVAPWRSVRAEHPLPDEVESRLLLREDPAAIAHDQDLRRERAGPAPTDLGQRRQDRSGPRTPTA